MGQPDHLSFHHVIITRRSGSRKQPTDFTSWPRRTAPGGHQALRQAGMLTAWAGLLRQSAPSHSTVVYRRIYGCPLRSSPAALWPGMRAARLPVGPGTILIAVALVYPPEV